LGSILFTRSSAIAGTAYLAVLLLLFWRLFTGGILNAGTQTLFSPPFVSADTIDAAPYYNFMEEDFSEQFAYFQEYQYRAAQQGRFPTWNPHIYLGQPFHADGQSAMLYPFNWVYFFVKPDDARGWLTIFRLWLSAAAVFCLLRKHAFSPSGAFAGGALWMLCSFNMHWLVWPHSNASLVLPLVVVAMDYLVLRPSRRTWAITALLAGALFLSGHPGTIYLASLTAGFYVLVRLILLLITGTPRRRVAIAAGASLGAMIAGLLVASIALLPLYMQIRRSFDYLDEAGARGAVDQLPLKTLWLFLVPEYFGRPRGGFPNVGFTGPENYIEMSLWFGAAGLALALGGALSFFVPGTGEPDKGWRDRLSFPAIFGISSLALSLLIVFSVHPFDLVAAAMPGSHLTSLYRLLMAAPFAGAILAGGAIHEMIARRGRIVSFLCCLISVAFCGLVFYAVLEQWDAQQQAFNVELSAITQQFGQNWPRVINGMIEQFPGYRMRLGALLLLLNTAVLICVLVQNLRRRDLSRTLRYLLMILITADVALPSVEWQPVTPPRLAVPQTPEVLESTMLHSSDGRMLGTDMLLFPNMSMHYNFRDTRGYDLPHSLRIVRLLQKLGIDGADHKGLRGVIGLNLLYPYIKPPFEAFLDRTCVMSLLTYVPDKNAIQSLTSLPLLRSFHKPGFEDWTRSYVDPSGVMVFDNPNAYSRTYFAETAARATDPADALDALLDIKTDLREHSVFEGSDVEQTDAPADTSGDLATISVDRPEQVVISTQTASRRLLVLADRMDNGWEVRIDGQRAPELTANYLFRGVFVPPGHHAVEWRYHAPGLMAGVIISSAMLASIILLWCATTVQMLTAARRRSAVLAAAA
jgi:hypothetical protein